MLSTNKKIGGMVLMNLKLGLPITAPLGNIDVWITSSLSTTCLHGATASLNHQPNYQNQGNYRELVEIQIEKVPLRTLPDWYSDVPPLHLPNEVTLPQNKDLPTAM